MRAIVLLLMLGLFLPVAAAAEDWLPDRRFVLSQDTDLPGGDMATLLDNTLETCESACRSRPDCTAFTFNTRNGSCFPKVAAGAGVAYRGAVSGRLAVTPPARQETARARAADLGFLSREDLAAARLQAQGLGREHPANGRPAGDHRRAAAAAGVAGDLSAAANAAGAAASAGDEAGDWLDYARRLGRAAAEPGEAQARRNEGAFRAATNAYLRADAALRHEALVELAVAAERIGRGRDMVAALRLAQALGPREATGALLASAAGKYGFRILGHEVLSDSPRPRICATFSEPLSTTADQPSFVRRADPALTVEVEERRICVGGMAHGARHTVTFREGLPAADGQVLAKSVEISAYVRDRTPTVRFPSRAYVLPKVGNPAIPVETVNARTLDLRLYRVSDRNLLRAIQQDYLGRPLDEWQSDAFTGEVGERIWSGSAEVGMELNRDVTTRLPMEEPLKGLAAGIYALRAAVPDQDPYDHPPAWQWFVVSDLGVTSLSGSDGLHVFVRSLGSAEPRPGVTVELLSRANAVLGTDATDAAGYARFAPGLTRGTGAAEPALLVVRDGTSDIAFLSLADPEFDLSDRGVEGHEPAPPVDLFLTTDRGAYRAGETVHVLALARDARAQAIEGLPLTAVLKRPDGVEYSRALVADAGAGGHVADLPVAGSAPRGVWRLELHADPGAPPLAARTFLVEDFLPERIDVTTSLPEAPIRPGDRPELEIRADWLFGAPGAGLSVEGEVTVRAAEGLAAFPGYVFGRQDQRFDPQVTSFGGQTTGEDGLARVTLALPEQQGAARPLEMVVTTRVAEGSGRPVERVLTRRLVPAAPVIGVRPLFEGAAPQGGEARFALIAAGPDERPVPARVRWVLNRVETDYQWYQQYGNWSWEPVVSRQPVAEGEAQLGAAPVEIGAPVDWGQYEILVERIEGPAAATSTRFHAGWYAPADATASPDTLDMSLDRPSYRPGETATLRLVPRAAGKALVMVLSNRLVAMKALEVTEGENLVALPVTDDWGTGVYVTAQVLRPMDAAAGRNPARALGLAHAAVDPGPRRLGARVETAAEAAPRGPLDVAVRVEGTAPGEEAFVTVAAVDQGILNLTAFATPDPEDHYFGQRKLGVGIRDLYGRLIDGLNGAQGAVRSGGDGGQARLQAPPPTEDLVAFFSGVVKVGPDGTARVRFDLPAFNGTVRVMAVAWSRSGVGHAEAQVLVRDPVVVTASLPRFLAPGDESRLRLDLTHASGPAGPMQLRLAAPGLGLGEAPASVELAEKGRARVEVPLQAGTPGLHEIAVTLTTPEGRTLQRTLRIPVQVGDPEVARQDRLTLDPGQTLTLDENLFAGLRPGTGRATLAIGPLARLDAPGLMASLDRYPYGCTEQVASKAMPLLYLDQVARALELPGAGNLPLRIGQAVDEVLTNQTAEGAFGLWRPQDGDFWLDAYVTDFLSRAKAQGHPVPAEPLRRALDNLRNQVNYAPDFDSGGEALAYALMVLAREGAAAIGDLRYYADVKADAFATPAALAQLGAALANYGDPVRADAMFRKAAARLNADRPAEQVWRIDYGTPRRDAAAVLALAAEAGSQAVDREAVTATLAGEAGPLSTQEASWMLLAANALIDRPGVGDVTIDGLPADGPLVRMLRSGAPPVRVANGGAPQVLTVTTTGVPAEPEPAGGNGYAIRRSYYTMAGEPADPARVAQGTRLVAVLEIEPFGRGEGRLMVNDPLPAGFEIDNPNLMRGGQVAALDWLDPVEEVTHAEFRQDRFLAALDRSGPEAFRLAYVVRAVSPGRFHHPAASVEDMYRPEFRARTAAGTVTVTP